MSTDTLALRLTPKNRLKIAAALAFLPAAPAFADEIVVTATKSPLPAAETGTSITVIDADALTRNQFQYVADALSQTAGLAIARNGAYGGQASLRIRGAASGRTLVLIDGVVVNDPSSPGGGYDFADLDVADIDRIEVLRGPQSILYGSEAIGGVVSITTKRSEGAPSVKAFIEGGSFATVRGGAGLAGASGVVDYAVNAFALNTNGISKAAGGSETDGARSIAASGGFGANLAENFRVETNLRYQNARNDYDGFPPPNYTLADTDAQEKSESFLATGRAILTLFDGRFENIATVGYNSIDRRDFDAGVETFSSAGNRLSADYLARIRAADWLSFVAGAETERTHINASGIKEDVTVNSVYGLAIVKPVSHLTLTAGGRHDDHETFGGKTTARVTGAYDIEEAGLVLRASWGQGFAAPTLFQLNYVCCGGTQPNRGLRPETSNGWDAGFDKNFDGRASLKATYFHQDSENLIDFDYASGAYINIDKTLRKGVEAEFALKPFSSVDLSASYAYVDAKDALTGAALLRQPKHAFTLNGAWRATDRLTLGSSVRYNGAEQDSAGPVGRYKKVDFRAAFAANERFEIFARLENAFDETYQDVLGYGEPGRSAFAGVRMKTR